MNCEGIIFVYIFYFFYKNGNFIIVKEEELEEIFGLIIVVGLVICLMKEDWLF